MSERLSVADVLDRAADLIEPEGSWMQHSLVRYVGDKPICWCALGALYEAGAYAEEAAVMVEANLPPSTPGVRLAITAWNDAPERTQAEVVAKLREAAALAREQSL